PEGRLQLIVERDAPLARHVEECLAVVYVEGRVRVLLKPPDDDAVLLLDLLTHAPRELRRVEPLPAQRVDGERAQGVRGRVVEVERVDAPPSERLDEGDAVVVT